MTHPHCHDRNVLTETAAGPRVHLSKLHMAFTPRERRRWFCLSIPIPHDDFGVLPDAVERFFSEVVQLNFLEE